MGVSGSAFRKTTATLFCILSNPTFLGSLYDTKVLFIAVVHFTSNMFVVCFMVVLYHGLGSGLHVEVAAGCGLFFIGSAKCMGEKHY